MEGTFSEEVAFGAQDSMLLEVWLLKATGDCWYSYGVSHKWGYPNSWYSFIRKHPVKMDDNWRYPYDSGNHHIDFNVFIPSAGCRSKCQGYSVHPTQESAFFTAFPTWKEHFSGWWFEPFWKIWKSIGIIIPNIWENKIDVPNHQPVFVTRSPTIHHT